MRATPCGVTAALTVASTLILACSKRESSNGVVANDSSAKSSMPAPGATASANAAGSVDSIIRGVVVSVSDSLMTVRAPNGEVRVALTEPVAVYERRAADLSRVTDHAFVGVTSVPQPDGTQRATEIHVFPEELRGLGAGSRPMATSGNGSRSTMTNGNVASSRMTNGNARMTNGAARMTNGSTRGAAGGTITVTYNGGSQTIIVPAGVTVTELVRTMTKLRPGANVIIPAVKQRDGTVTTSRVMLAAERR